MAEVPEGESETAPVAAADARPERRVGSMLGRTYRLDAVLGAGGHGVVYAASHVRLPRRFAIKVLNAEHASHPELFARFRREAEITSALGHPNIVQVFDFDVGPSGEGFMVLELLEGESVDDRLERVGRLPLEEALELGIQAARGLAAAHRQGVVHRDVKPSNLFLARHAEGETLKVLDFGVSKLLGGERQTGTGQTLGTPGYMAPEQLRAEGERIDARTDVFALGIVLHEMVAGAHPFDAPTIDGVYYRICHEPPTPLVDRSLAPLEPLLARALAKSPEDRFPDVAAMLEAIEGVRRTLGPATHDSPVAVETRPSAPRRRWAWLAVGSVALILGAGLGVSHLWSRADVAHSASGEGAAPTSPSTVSTAPVSTVSTAPGPSSPASRSADPSADAVESPRRIEVPVSLDPPTARLMVDGREASGPGALSFDVGSEHVFEAHAEGHAPARTRVVVEPGSAVSLALDPLPEVDSSPSRGRTRVPRARAPSAAEERPADDALGDLIEHDWE